MQLEVFTPPPDCPDPEGARAATQLRFQQLLDRVTKNGRVSGAEMPAVEELLRQQVAEHDIFVCDAPGKERCAGQVSCWLARHALVGNVNSPES